MCIHPPFDLAVGCVVDNLHQVYLGVTLALLKLWFAQEYKREDYSIYSQVLINVLVDSTIMLMNTRLYVHK